jgi:ribosome-associated toxin RatA of RatAB toxin-antitoxin module
MGGVVLKIPREVSVFPRTPMRPLSAIGLVLACSLGAPIAHAQSASSSFSAEERARLSRGELVVRREAQQRGELRMIGGTSWQVVDAPPAEVWAAVLAVDDWTEFLPQAVESRLLRNQPGRRDVFIRHQKGPISASYTIRLEFMEGRQMARFRVDTSRPSAIRDGWGFFIVQPFGEDRTMVTFGVLADVGSGMITGLARPTVHEWMMRVPEELARHVERQHRAQHARR